MANSKERVTKLFIFMPIVYPNQNLSHTSVAMTFDKYTHYATKEDNKRGQFLKGRFAPNDTENDTKFLRKMSGVQSSIENE